MWCNRWYDSVTHTHTHTVKHDTIVFSLRLSGILYTMKLHLCRAQVAAPGVVVASRSLYTPHIAEQLLLGPSGSVGGNEFPAVTCVCK